MKIKQHRRAITGRPVAQHKTCHCFRIVCAEVTEFDKVPINFTIQCVWCLKNRVACMMHESKYGSNEIRKYTYKQRAYLAHNYQSDFVVCSAMCSMRNELVCPCSKCCVHN